MPALNHKLFADKVESGEKRCTIRAKRKRPIKVNDPLYHFTGMMHKGCRKLRQSVCIKTTPVVIVENRVFVGDEDLTADQIIDLAHADGFDSGREFLNYFNSVALRFEGDLIQW